MDHHLSKLLKDNPVVHLKTFVLPRFGKQKQLSLSFRPERVEMVPKWFKLNTACKLTARRSPTKYQLAVTSPQLALPRVSLTGPTAGPRPLPSARELGSLHGACW